MTLSANLRAALRGKMRRVHDPARRGDAEARRIASQWIGHLLNVPSAGPMAGLARNAEFANLGLRQIRARELWSGPSVRRVAHDAVRVPARVLRIEHFVGWNHEHGAAREP